MKNLLIKFLFRLLDVDFKTKDLVPFDDLKSIAGEKRATEITKHFRDQKYTKALASAYYVEGLNEWLYLQVVTKRNEHILTLDEDKRKAQQAAMLTFLRMIEEMRIASEDLLKIKRPNK